MISKLENQHHISVSDELIARYLAGEAKPEEALALHDWLQTPGNKEHFDAISATWHAMRSERKPRDIDSEPAWLAIEKRMRAIRRADRIWRYVSIAALLTMFVSTGLWYFNSKSTDGNLREIVTTNSLEDVQLPDGSSVTLNRRSQITFSESFESGREISLHRGEAFFDVASDKLNPFTVHTPLARIRVVGTSFNVLLDDEQLKVDVREGRVIVATTSDTITLEGGYSAVLKAGERKFTVSDHVDVNDWSYATRLFVFRDTPLGEVIPKIAKSYGCEVKTANEEIKRCRVTATFDNVTAENMLSLIAETLNLSVERNGAAFTIQGEGCQ